MVAKLPRSGPDGVVIDMEDAVPPNGKADARVVGRELGARLAGAHPEIAVYVRVNSVVSEWFDDDVRTALSPELAGVVVPKLESVTDLERVVGALERAGCGDLGVLAGIESAAGVGHVEELLRPPVTVAYFGAEDFVVDMGGVRTAAGTEVLYRSRSRWPRGSRACTRWTRSSPPSTTSAPSSPMPSRVGHSDTRARCASTPPRSPGPTACFTPSPEEIEHARRLLAAYEAAADAGEAVIAFEGQMVDEPMARRARAQLEAAPDG